KPLRIIFPHFAPNQDVTSLLAGDKFTSAVDEPGFTLATAGRKEGGEDWETLRPERQQACGREKWQDQEWDYGAGVHALPHSQTTGRKLTKV
ncbi:hypothetical protein INR49_027820, partial [Caranx melampygus]